MDTMRGLFISLILFFCLFYVTEYCKHIEEQAFSWLQVSSQYTDSVELE